MTNTLHKHKKILIVEDEVPLLKLLEEKFSSDGFETYSAKNGDEGLALALEKHPDLILCDIMMPKMDGITMCTILRKDAWGKTVKFIFLTNLDDKTKVTEAIDTEVFDYIVKSDWKLEDVVRKVKEVLASI